MLNIRWWASATEIYPSIDYNHPQSSRHTKIYIEKVNPKNKTNNIVATFNSRPLNVSTNVWRIYLVYLSLHYEPRKKTGRKCLNSLSQNWSVHVCLFKFINWFLPCYANKVQPTIWQFRCGVLYRYGESITRVLCSQVSASRSTWLYQSYISGIPHPRNLY